MQKTEAQVLADTMDYTRQFAFFYLNRLKQVDLHKTFECGEKKLNNVFWLVAHLTVSENYLLLHITGGEMEKFSWGKLFGLGSPVPAKEICPPFDEVMDKFNLVHTKAMAHIGTLSDADLEKPNLSALTLPGNTWRKVIQHAIRHEASHIGHLSWLCKLHGIKTL